MIVKQRHGGRNSQELRHDPQVEDILCIAYKVWSTINLYMKTPSLYTELGDNPQLADIFPMVNGDKCSCFSLSHLIGQEETFVSLCIYNKLKINALYAYNAN